MKRMTKTEFFAMSKEGQRRYTIMHWIDMILEFIGIAVILAACIYIPTILAHIVK